MWMCTKIKSIKNSISCFVFYFVSLLEHVVKPPIQPYPTPPHTNTTNSTQPPPHPTPIQPTQPYPTPPPNQYNQLNPTQPLPTQIQPTQPYPPPHPTPHQYNSFNPTPPYATLPHTNTTNSTLPPHHPHTNTINELCIQEQLSSFVVSFHIQ